MKASEQCLLTIYCIDCPSLEHGERSIAWEDRAAEMAKLEATGWRWVSVPVLQTPNQARLPGFCPTHAPTGVLARIPD